MEKEPHVSCSDARPTAISIAVIGSQTATDEDGDEYTIFHIEISEGGQLIIRCGKRFSDFQAFHEMAVVNFPKISLPTLPPKKLFGRFDHEFVEERRTQLEHYIQELFQVEDPFRSVLFKFVDPLNTFGRYETVDGVESSPEDLASVLYDFHAEEEGMLTIRVGDIITVLERDGETGWWKGRIAGREGFFPGSYVKPASTVAMTEARPVQRWSVLCQEERKYLVSIPSASKGYDMYITYHIQVHRDGSVSHVKRRYSEFDSLNTELRGSFPTVSLPALPPKTLTLRFDDGFIDKRRLLLQEYLKQLFSIPDPFVKYLWEFFDRSNLLTSSVVGTEEQVIVRMDRDYEGSDGELSFKAGEFVRIISNEQPDSPGVYRAEIVGDSSRVGFVREEFMALQTSSFGAESRRSSVIDSDGYSETDILKKGYLKKEGLFVRNPKKRWFILRKGVLEYYENEFRTSACLGTISLGRRSRLDVDAKNPENFSIKDSKSGRHFRIIAASVEEANDWIESINDIIQGRGSASPDGSVFSSDSPFSPYVAECIFDYDAQDDDELTIRLVIFFLCFLFLCSN
eukprot:TRINITY_DN1932_c0_g1_i6.p1 TRINITY_DN1932_c0_g1~~TRINITY_DN1932_c0_g1_i6.p1  ORF type:complete len:570 (+),score=104.47 TRINITY_DN1932_c0_g1_i6:120-1829(+)